MIGVKFIFNQEDYERFGLPQVKYKLSYCSMVKQAAMGSGSKASINQFLCIGSAKSLGLVKPDIRAISGNVYHSFGLYDSLGMARKVQKDVTVLDHQAYGVAVMPLVEVEAESDPDVVIFIANPYQSMRIMQGYAYHHGAAKNIKMVSNSGVCSECTATPYDTNDLNVSLLCSNTRFAAKWKDHELGIGIPFNMLERVYEGIIKTIGPCETHDRKLQILERCRQAGIEPDFSMDSTYFNSGPIRMNAKQD